MKRMVDELQVVFTNANTYGKDAQRFKTGIAKDMTVEQAPTEKEVIHPLVRTHPETGRKSSLPEYDAFQPDRWYDETGI